MLDHHIRTKAFEWLTKQVDFYGEVLPRELLAQGFQIDDQRIPLLGPQGIWKPRVIPEIPLSITTVPEGPYDDKIASDGLLFYRYRGNNPQHRDNAGLRKAMQDQVPLIYFHGVVKGQYLAVWPIYIVSDDPANLTFTVAADDVNSLSINNNVTDGNSVSAESRRLYITSTVRQRLHQSSFRERVLRAYREQCALCRLKHRELLDAAHIIPDSEPQGEPIISNGIALCKLHHAAFDRNFLGIRPDYKIEIRKDILEETDGPMLQHGLKELHNLPIILPRDITLRPNPEFLEKRYQRFREAG